MEKRELALAAVEDLRSRGYQVDVNKVSMRGGREGICIRSEEINIVPTIYIDSLPDEIETAEDMADWILAFHDANVPKESVNPEKWLTDEYLKEHIWPMLRFNAPSTVIYKDYLGMKETLKIEVSFETPNKEPGYITVTEEMLKIIEADREQLFAWAEANIKKAEFYNVTLADEQIIEALKAGNEDLANKLLEQMNDPLLREIALMQRVARSEKYENAGTALMDKEFLKRVCEELETDEVTIIPSSISEIIIIPSYIALGELSEAIKEVNNTMLAPEDVLSYHAFTYSAITNELEIIRDLKAGIFNAGDITCGEIDIENVANNLNNGVFNG